MVGRSAPCALHRLPTETVHMLQHVVACLHAEIHFDNPEMRGSFGFNLTTELPDVINEIQGFRMKGLRIHYWP